MKTICYTGIEAKDDGNHTKEEFLKIMEENNFAKECQIDARKKKCKPCKTYKKNMKKYMKKIKSNSDFNKIDKLLKPEKKACDKCKTKDLKPCSLKQYMKYSGAERGPCQKGGNRKSLKRKSLKRKSLKR
jgi:hypothetical protein